jgi:hypothetical protein
LTKARASVAALGLAFLLGACRAQAPPADVTAADSVPVAAAEPTLANTFDPGAVQPGDTVLGLVVVSKDVQRAAAVDSVWVGNVVFEGDLVVQGVYQPHYDWPEVTAPCFHVTDPVSIARMPRFVPDEWTSPDGKTWFCFSNPEVAIELLGAPEEPREMVIALGRFQLWRQMSDAYSMAELAELIEAGPASRRTLLDP